MNQPFQPFQQVKVYYPFVGPFDPCPPIKEKTYMTPPNLYMMFQPPNLPQFSPFDALKHGTLWPALVSPYSGKNAKIGKK
ncbi:spore coat associated protein CotJA [Ferviditalea candida]|uniref:Spore coat associated protein CotJA n=1 Tax=Ferviditalea candida TaxID=3108399 RepID=A0ABU5ZIS2_9BACL|nr:spore coat associated protein CotJA [Paenibacillaceae bacterium T2]